MSFKSGSKSKETFESWESLFRKTLSKDGLLNFVKPVDNPIHWIHLLDPFEHQSSNKVSGETRASSYMNLSGWPLIPFSKVQMLKCEKCCLEFCSPVNHRRHLRVVHRRGSNTEKENVMSLRQELSAFWDALSAEEVGKIVDIKGLFLEDLIGEKVVKALSQFLQQPALLALPHAYVKAGAMLLELVQRSSSKPLLSSSELFKIFDGSSEKTFPSFGLHAMHKYIFEGEAGKVGLEAKNLVSSLGLLLEVNLVKAFIKDKDEEAQRCQTALVEEEEAYQRKQAQLQQRKRSKKACHKDMKDKEQKLPDSSKASFSSASESSGGDEPLDGDLITGYEVLSKSSPNVFEKLYDTLGGDEVDSEICCKDNGAPMQMVENDAEVTEPEGSDVSHLHSDAAFTLVTNCSNENSMQDSPRSVVSFNVAGSDGEADETVAKDPVHPLVLKEPPGVGKLVFKEKRKYHSLQSPRTQEFRAPSEKFAWKEKDDVNSRKSSSQMAAPCTKEATDLGGPDLGSEDLSASRSISQQNRQFVSKFVRNRKYPSAASSRSAIWTKKASKGNEAEVEEVSDQLSSVDVHQPVYEVPAVDFLENTVSSSVTSPLFSPQISVCTQESSVVEEAACCPGANSVACRNLHLENESHHNQAGDSLSPIAVGSLVIGSVCVSFSECLAGQNRCDLLSDVQVEAARTKTSEACDSKSASSAQFLGKTEESLRALNENGAVSSVPFKEQERNGKAVKFSLQMDVEEKENHEHPLPYCEAKSCRPVAGQAGFRGGRVKVWRPVSSLSHELRDRTCGSAGVDLDAVTDQSNHNLSEKPEKLKNLECDGSEEFTGQTVLEDNSKWCLNASIEKDTQIQVSTLEAVRCFLSQRWSAAVNASDTVVLTLEDEMEHESHYKGLCEDATDVGLCEDATDVGPTVPPLQTNKEPLTFTRNGRNLRGLWKEGCSGSAMVMNRQTSGRNFNFHAAPRFTNYRYVPK